MYEKPSVNLSEVQLLRLRGTFRTLPLLFTRVTCTQVKITRRWKSTFTGPIQKVRMNVYFLEPLACKTKGNSYLTTYLRMRLCATGRLARSSFNRNVLRPMVNRLR